MRPRSATEQSLRSSRMLLRDTKSWAIIELMPYGLPAPLLFASPNRTVNAPLVRWRPAIWRNSTADLPAVGETDDCLKLTNGSGHYVVHVR